MLAGAGSVGLAGLLGKKWGFSRSVRKAPVFYGLVALGTVGGTALSLLHVNPIKLLVFVAVINGVAAAPFLVVVMWVSGSKRLMGDYVNGNAAKILGWTHRRDHGRRSHRPVRHRRNQHLTKPPRDRAADSCAVFMATAYGYG